MFKHAFESGLLLRTYFTNLILTKDRIEKKVLQYSSYIIKHFEVQTVIVHILYTLTLSDINLPKIALRQSIESSKEEG